MGYRFEGEPLAVHAATGFPIVIGCLRACRVEDPVRRAAAWSHAVVALLLADTRVDQGLTSRGFEALPVDLSGGEEGSQPRYLWVRRAGGASAAGGGSKVAGSSDLFEADDDSEEDEAHAKAVEDEAGPVLDVWVGPHGARPSAPGFRPLSSPVHPMRQGLRVWLWSRSMAPRPDPATEAAEAAWPVMLDAEFAGVSLPPMPARMLVPPGFVRRRVAARARAQYTAALRVREAAVKRATAVRADAEGRGDGQVSARRGITVSGPKGPRSRTARRRGSDSSLGSSVVPLGDADDSAAAGHRTRWKGLAAEPDPLRLFLGLLHVAADEGAASGGLPSAGGFAPSAEAGASGRAGMTPARHAEPGAGFPRSGTGAFGLTPGAPTPQRAGSPHPGGIAAVSARRGRPVRLPTFLGADFALAGGAESLAPPSAQRLQEAARTPVAGIHAAIAAAGGTMGRQSLLSALRTGALDLYLEVSRQPGSARVPPPR